jgi:TATA-binding protein-associated factor
LQRVKRNIASSIVTQQNNSLDSMNTSEVLDLFKISTGEEDAAAQAAKRRAAVESGGPVSQKSLLEGLEDMPNEDEYEGLGMDSFLNGLG